MAADLSALLLLFLAGWFWLDAMRAHELATVLAGRACEAHDLQMLDQAVALRRLGLSWGQEGLRLRRAYRFEFSNGGIDRQTGELILVGLRLELLTLNREPAREQGPPRPLPDAPLLVRPTPRRPFPHYPTALGWMEPRARPDLQRLPGEDRLH